jgi:hypothetical protein
MRLPKVRLLIAGPVVFTLLFLVFSILVVPEGRPREFHFASERGSITALSSIYLAMGSAFSLGAFMVGIRNDDSHRWLFGIMGGALTFLAFDEVFQFHEGFGLLMGSRVGSSVFRSWNDIIVIVYGLIALPTLALLLPSILRHRMLMEMLGVSFLFYVLHTAIDSTQEPRTTLSAISEESAKLFCVLFLLFGALLGFLGSIWGSRDGGSGVQGGIGKA